MARLIEDFDLDVNSISESVLPSEPPCLKERAEVDFSLHNVSKDNATCDFHRVQFNEYCERNQEFTYIFTDGSKDNTGVACLWSSSLFSKTT